MKYYISFLDFNWADEIDFSGYELFTEKQHKAFIDFFNALIEINYLSVNVYIGSNEDVDFFMSTLMQQLNDSEIITEDQFRFINDIMGKNMGTITYSDIVNNIIDELYDRGIVNDEFVEEWQKKLF